MHILAQLKVFSRYRNFHRISIIFPVSEKVPFHFKNSIKFGNFHGSGSNDAESGRGGTVHGNLPPCSRRHTVYSLLPLTRLPKNHRKTRSP